jgi:hypothetical protein
MISLYHNVTSWYSRSVNNSWMTLIFMAFCLGNRWWGTQHRCWMIKSSEAVRWWWTMLLVRYKRVYKFVSCPISLEFEDNIVHLLFHYRKLLLEFRSSILSVPLANWMSLGLCLSRFPTICLWLYCWAFPGLCSRSYSISPESVKRKRNHMVSDVKNPVVTWLNCHFNPKIEQSNHWVMNTCMMLQIFIYTCE